MSALPTNLVVAGLGPFAELIGVTVLVALFTLLRGQADRRPYFKAWEESWVMLAVALTAGVIYQRLTDPTGVLYSSSHIWPWLFGFAYLAFKLLALALLVSGSRIYVLGARERWYVWAAVPVALLLPFAHGTLVDGLALQHGPFSVVAYAVGTWLFAGLPPSRRSVGTRLARAAFGALTLLWFALAIFQCGARLEWGLAAMPTFVRLNRYAFYLDLLLQLALAYAMVRLLFEDGEREAADTQAQVELLHDRERLRDLHDEETGLLSRRAFNTSVGLDFARASFGSVLRLRVTNFERTAATHGGPVGDAMLKHFAAMLDSAVRAHDRVYRWEKREFLVVMPRAVPTVAGQRMRSVLLRASPLQMASVRDVIRAEVTVAVAAFSGAEDLDEAVRSVEAQAGAP